MEWKEATELLNKEKQLLYKWTPPCEHVLTSGIIWPLDPEHFPVSTWLLLQTRPSHLECTEVEQESTFLPLYTPSDKQTGSHHSFSTSAIFCSQSSSLPRSNRPCFSFCDKSSTRIVVFSALSRTGKQGDNKKQETSSFLNPNYHCMIVSWLWLFCLTTESDSGFDHTPFRHTVVGGYHYHVTVSP